MTHQAIALNALRFHYPEQLQQPIIYIADWSLAQGEHVFIHGPSGSGKSTLLSLLSGLLTPSDGQLTMLGQDLTELSNRARDQFRANHIGYVFQQFNLIPYLNAVDNIRLANHFSKQTNIASAQIEALLSKLNIHSADWLKPASRLSVGQQQRVAIARALINQPEILIADEPTSALDQTNRDAFMALLMETVADNNISLVFVSHDLSLAKHFSRVEALSDFNQPAART